MQQSNEDLTKYDGDKRNEDAIISQIAQRRNLYGEDADLAIVVDSAMWEYMVERGFHKHCKGISEIRVITREGKSVFQVHVVEQRINMSSDSVRFISER